jgi:hypothetical protein
MFCWFFRIKISHAADTDRRLDRMTQRHAQRCESCRRFYERCQSLGDGLRAGAMDPSLGCERLIERITDALAGLSKNTRHARIGRKQFAAAACIILAVAAGIKFISGPPRQRSSVAPMMSVGDLLQTDVEATWAGLVEKPLSGQIESLTENTESAIRFLVACVDVGPLQNVATADPE